MTHYQTLGVAENTSQDEIKKAYRKLAMQHHPDRNNGDDTKFKEIQIAYDALSDEQKRQQYDMQRQNPGGVRFNINGGPGHPDIEEMLRNFGFAQGGLDPFQNFRQPRRNKDIRVEVVIPLTSTLDPQIKTISVQTTNGQRQTVNVNIPRGVRSDSTIKYSGLGDTFFDNLPTGDLYIQIQVNNDTDFAVDGLNLYKVIDITAIDAIIGSKINVNSIDRKSFEMIVPAGTQHGTKFKIPGNGLYTANHSSRGSLIVVVNIVIPTDLTSDQLQTLRTFNNNKN